MISARGRGAAAAAGHRPRPPHESQRPPLPSVRAVPLRAVRHEDVLGAPLGSRPLPVPVRARLRRLRPHVHHRLPPRSVDGRGGTATTGLPRDGRRPRRPEQRRQPDLGAARPSPGRHRRQVDLAQMWVDRTGKAATDSSPAHAHPATACAPNGSQPIISSVPTPRLVSGYDRVPAQLR